MCISVTGSGLMFGETVRVSALPCRERERMQLYFVLDTMTLNCYHSPDSG